VPRINVLKVIKIGYPFIKWQSIMFKMFFPNTVYIRRLMKYIYRSSAGSFNCCSSALVSWPTQLNPPFFPSKPWRRPFSSAKKLSSLVKPGWCNNWTVAWAICSSPQCLWILPDLPLHNHTHAKTLIQNIVHHGPRVFHVLKSLSR